MSEIFRRRMIVPARTSLGPTTLMEATQRPFGVNCFADVSTAARRDVYARGLVAGGQDKVIPAALERWFCRRAGAREA
ncbi:hypothetical protein [Streptomyces sp. NBC_00986]|uniref:hypothetical protein n=1 Tax=Streptomyces sp. NBC_00986 TaxID=2903702 RepID=UPI003863EB57|nr:hypothetical protein OG504_08395 [Streptomyces sp. NBC_00986]